MIPGLSDALPPSAGQATADLAALMRARIQDGKRPESAASGALDGPLLAPVRSPGGIDPAIAAEIRQHRAQVAAAADRAETKRKRQSLVLGGLGFVIGLLLSLISGQDSSLLHLWQAGQCGVLCWLAIRGGWSHLLGVIVVGGGFVVISYMAALRGSGASLVTFFSWLGALTWGGLVCLFRRDYWSD